jgi:hypothetical protein
MPNQFAATIDSFIFQANNLQIQFQQFQTRAKNLKKNPVRDFLSEVGGAVGQNLFDSRAGRLIGRAVTKAYLANQEGQQLSQEDKRLNLAPSILIAGVRSFLTSVSIKSKFETYRKQWPLVTKAPPSRGEHEIRHDASKVGLGTPRNSRGTSNLQ